MTQLRLRGIRKRFGATAALDGVDFDVSGGEVHALIGENGAGKSTLMNILSGTFAPDDGAMFLDDVPYAPARPADARRYGIAHIHQELALCPHLSVAENIFLGIEPSRREMHTRATRLLDEFGRGEVDPARRAGDLPLADQQVVEICRALAFDARVLLMDEPTSSLQRGDVERLFRLIGKLRERGVAVIYISHFLEELREIAERYTVLRDGRSVSAGALAAVSNEELIAAMVARSMETIEREQIPAVSEDVLLSVRNLAAPHRVHSATFDLRRGEILGIAGLIGSGRSELIRAIFGLLRTSGGEVSRRGTIGYLSEDRKGEGLALQLSVADNVTMSRLRTCARAGWIDLRRQNAQAEEVMRRLRVKAAGPRSAVMRLSGGNQQKVVLGRLLHQDADILLLDEPTRGIDVGSKADIFAEIAQLAREGKAIVVVSSYLPDLFAVCDRIAVMCRGRLSEAKATAEWTPDLVMQTAIGGSEKAA
ncbi:MAG: sugar ABC transporter ATP-binding protein [Acidobacteria bacterium]|nr:sugar ABC transporter ATP-binding protein [Acidobacteriota bacterium]MBV9186200.1 sugar ABC transporter ATP-binding protein [Acidobacteriota bacterium]